MSIRTHRRLAFHIAAPLLSSLVALSAQAAPAFPGVLSANTTGLSAALFTGAPDDQYAGLGADEVIFDFGAVRVVNRSGAVDLNVYEVDFGAPEFSAMTILVSQDGVTFTSIKASEVAVVDIAGDGTHGPSTFARSYDLGAYEWVRYVRIDGLGSGRAGGTNGFDLDAIGAHDVVPVPVPEPGTWALMAAGLALLPILRRARA